MMMINCTFCTKLGFL